MCLMCWRLGPILWCHAAALCFERLTQELEGQWSLQSWAQGQRLSLDFDLDFAEKDLPCRGFAEMKLENWKGEAIPGLKKGMSLPVTTILMASCDYKAEF